MKKTFLTNYFIAVHWLHNSLILCNGIVEVDPSVYDNMRFDLYNEYDEPKDIYQWYLTDCSQSDVEYLEKHFGLLFTYSETLDLFVLCVDHWGTPWKGVAVDTDLEYAAEEAQKDMI